LSSQNSEAIKFGNPDNFTAFPPNVKLRVPAFSYTVSGVTAPKSSFSILLPRVRFRKSEVPTWSFGASLNPAALSGIHATTHSPRGSSTGECPSLSLPSAFGGEREHYTLPEACATLRVDSSKTFARAGSLPHVGVSGWA